MSDNEIWKDVVGYEGLYQVSNLGRVKRIGYVNFSVFTKFCKIILTDMKGVLEE